MSFMQYWFILACRHRMQAIDSFTPVNGLTFVTANRPARAQGQGSRVPSVSSVLHARSVPLAMAANSKHRQGVLGGRCHSAPGSKGKGRRRSPREDISNFALSKWNGGSFQHAKQRRQAGGTYWRGRQNKDSGTAKHTAIGSSDKEGGPLAGGERQGKRRPRGKDMGRAAAKWPWHAYSTFRVLYNCSAPGAREPS